MFTKKATHCHLAFLRFEAGVSCHLHHKLFVERTQIFFVALRERQDALRSLFMLRMSVTQSPLGIPKELFCHRISLQRNYCHLCS